MKKWECGIPGKQKTLWEGGLFKLDMIFPDGVSFASPFFIFFLRYSDFDPRLLRRSVRILFQWELTCYIQ
jgi:Ubiquitin-conjugating enzyme